MKQVLIKKGEARLDEVPSPMVSEGYVLVQVLYSCISVGTEISGVKATGLPLWKRAMQQPENVKKVIDTVGQMGVKRTYQLVKGQLDAGNVTGYSAAGRVLEVGSGIDDLVPGDMVACAGAQHANHAEVIGVPRKLTVKIQDGVDVQDASSVTLGAIAMQGLRRANPTLGETIVVLGLGILGQITAQMLKANGCTVIGIDLDNSRVKIAEENGMHFGITSEEKSAHEQVMRLTDGVGADAVIITAAASSNQIMSDSFKMCRKKGRVVIVGDVGLDLKRGDFYSKEIDVLISCSYGPGRYDYSYEEKGMEYPIGYVRWTENRNMQAYLNLIKTKAIGLKGLTTQVYDIEEVSQAYDKLKQPGEKPLLSFLKYSDSLKPDGNVRLNEGIPATKAGIINMALVGAGGFAKGMHLPNMQSLSNSFQLGAVVSRTGHNAESTARRYGAAKSTTKLEEVLTDQDVDAAIVATRHNTHADIALKLLKAGKHVLLEKPTALTQEELNQFKAFYSEEAETKPILLTGYNRRFSMYNQEIKRLLANRSNPVIINYRMNAGYIPLDHWVHTEEGGGRNIGEACHIYDLFTFFTESPVKAISAHGIAPQTDAYGRNDNFMATISFEDGSIANLLYTASGSRDLSKEYMEVFYDGKTIVMDDYKSISYFGTSGKSLKSSIPSKGQKEELIAFGKAINGNSSWPIPLWEQMQTAEICFEVEKMIFG